jgi:hypothetical protein
MKNIFIYLLILIFTISCSKKSTISQAEPFENTLISVKNYNIILFKNSFSERIQNEKIDSLTWSEKLKVAEERLELAFTELNPDDFSYEFDEKESVLIIKHKTYQPFSMKIVLENGKWKLDEH